MVPLLEENGKRFGEQLLYVYSGLFGKREIEDLLIMWNFHLCNLLTWTKLFIGERLIHSRFY